ncbi:MAG: GTPase ObgE [Kiritimatiellaeota bacterium]|nr:GTPase ObgE [Kiritimatiellota bacterium]
MKSRRFIDRVSVQVRSGKGGDGSKSFRREKFVPRGGPDGGDGGRGGHVIFVGDENTDSLQPLFFENVLHAPDGERGSGQGMHGADGRDLVRNVPCGTQVFDNATGARLADITGHGEVFIVARGGAGGLGNIHFKSATNQAPEKFTFGKPGQEYELLLELKSIADAGLVGFPSAGKSSLLAAVSDARPKIAAYPFTTLNPVIGVARLDEFSRVKIADIPGIIQNAHEGAGLGIDFLRHIARSRALVFVVDMAGGGGREPWVDFKTLRVELKAHDPALLKLPSVVVANKMDVPEAKKNLSVFKRKFRTVKPVPVSTLTGAGLDGLKKVLLDVLKPTAGGTFQNAEPPPVASGEPCHETTDDEGIITPERLAGAGFLDLPKKKERQR